jgi:hypothetical protein
MNSRNLIHLLGLLIVLCFSGSVLAKGSSHPKAPCVYTQSGYDLIETCPKYTTDRYQKVVTWKDYYTPANSAYRVEAAKKAKEPMPWTTKLIFGLIVTLVAIIIGWFMWIICEGLR